MISQKAARVGFDRTAAGRPRFAADIEESFRADLS